MCPAPWDGQTANFVLKNSREECLSSSTQVHQEGLAGRTSGNPMPRPDAVGGSIASQGVVPLWATWQLLPWRAGLASGFRTAGRATSGSRMAGFPGLERKFRRGRPRGKSVCLCGRKGRIARTVSEATGSEVSRRSLSEAARVPGWRRGVAGGRCPVLGRPGQGCARGGRAAARWPVGDPIVGRRLSRVSAPLWAGASRGAGRQMPLKGCNDPGSEPKFPLWRMGDDGHRLESGSRVEVRVPRA